MKYPDHGSGLETMDSMDLVGDTSRNKKGKGIGIGDEV